MPTSTVEKVLAEFAWNDISAPEAEVKKVLAEFAWNDISAPEAEVEKVLAEFAWTRGTPVAVVPDISGAPTVLATFDGSGSEYPDYYAWEWTSVPGGSAIANYPIALPDNGATSLMVDNKLLLHFEGNANDTSGNSHNGTVTGATQVAGKVGSFAYSFDGVTDVITVSNNADFARGAGVSFTMVGWVKADAPIGHWEGICYHSSAGNSQGHLGIDPSGNLSGGTGDGATWAAVGSSHAVTAGTWMHVAMVVDRSANTLVLYADGVNVASSAWTAVPGTTTDDLTVGRGYGTGESFDGTIDEFAIWKRALSPTEIATIYDQQSKTGLGISTATAAFTPDIAGTYTVQLTVADGVSVTADAVIAAAGGGRQRRRKGRPRGRGFSVAEINSSLGAGFNSAFD